MMRSRILQRQEGFTLIEIIAVLVLLGILAAVAVPKFVSMQEDAELKSVQGVKSELVSRANQYFAKYLLTNSTTGMPTDAANWRSNEDLGDDFSYNGGGATTLRIRVEASGNEYDIPFTPAVYASDDTGTPATFGEVTPYP